MPTVDFTLEDLKQVFVTKDEFDDRVRGAAREAAREVVREELVAEREVTHGMIRDALRDALVEERKVTEQMMADTFLSFWDNNLGPAFDELHGEFAELKSRVRRLEREVRA